MDGDFESLDVIVSRLVDGLCGPEERAGRSRPSLVTQGGRGATVLEFKGSSRAAAGAGAARLPMDDERWAGGCPSASQPEAPARLQAVRPKIRI